MRGEKGWQWTRPAHRDEQGMNGDPEADGPQGADGDDDAGVPDGGGYSIVAKEVNPHSVLREPNIPLWLMRCLEDR